MKSEKTSSTTSVKSPVSYANVRHQLISRSKHLSDTYRDFSDSLSTELHQVIEERNAGSSVIPELNFDELANGAMPLDTRLQILKHGCVVVRNTFDRDVATRWNDDIAEYLENNHYYAELQSDLQTRDGKRGAHPQILDIYWSKAQLDARQSPRMVAVKAALNGLWQTQQDGASLFNPDADCTYADRLRIREPGDQSLALNPHVDGGSIEGWFDSNSAYAIHKSLLQGNWQDYDPFNAAFRVTTSHNVPTSPCSMYRTYQGWTALSKQGADGGTLQLLPSVRGLAWAFLRSLQSDVIEDDSAYATPGVAFGLDPHLHAQLIAALCSIPEMHAGDSVWWHQEVVHAVEEHNRSDGYSNVMYIGASPDCPRNRQYLKKQAKSFLTGGSPPDYPAANLEGHYEGRGSINDLTELGRQQLGLN